MTAAMVKAAGREDVCSICGDKHSVDYRRTDTSGALSTIRLDKDCVQIQGGAFTPVN